MNETGTDGGTASSLAAERLRLEREALALERERLAAARAHAEAEAKLAAGGARSPWAAPAFALLAALLGFAGGMISGLTVAENRTRREREERLARALSQLDELAAAADAAETNAPPAETGLPAETRVSPLRHGAIGTAPQRHPIGAHRNVSVLVIQ